MIATRSLQAASAAFEVGAGLALLAVPMTSVRLVLGADFRGAAAAGRVCGLALLALGLACRPKRNPRNREANTRAVRVLGGYNTLAAAGLAQLGIFGRHRGVALLPAVAIHAVFAALFAGRARPTRAR